jgi:hypothetical protein
MSFVRSIPKLGGLPELHVFTCAHCGEAETHAARHEPDERTV